MGEREQGSEKVWTETSWETQEWRPRVGPRRRRDHPSSEGGREGKDPQRSGRTVKEEEERESLLQCLDNDVETRLRQESVVVRGVSTPH